MRESSNSTRRQTLWVLGIALVCRLLVIRSVILHYPAGWLFSARGIEMDLLAKSLLSGDGLSSPFGSNTGPTAFIAPAYPIFVAGMFRLFGIDTNLSAGVIMLLHAAANLITIWCMMRIANHLAGKGAALCAGLVWAISPPLIFLPTIFWDTSFAIALTMGLLALALHFRGNATARVWISLGAYAALAALLNPALIPLLFSVLLWLAFQQNTNAARNFILSACTFAIVFAPWPIRNARVFHAFIPTRTTVGFELWMGNHDGASGFLEENLFPMYNRAELADYNRVGEVSYTNHKSDLAQTYIRQHPATFATLTEKRIIRYWTGTGTRNGSLFFALHATFTTLFGLLGVGFLFTHRRASLGFLFALPLLFFPLPYYITHAEFRYRLLLDPILTVLAAYALNILYKRYTRSTKPPQAAHA